MVERVLADLPRVNTIFDANGPLVEGGCWSTEPDCYRLIAERSSVGQRTLETGAGASTALFALLGTEHTCVVWSQEEVDRFQAYCEERGISTERIDFRVGPSERVLPGLDPGELELVFIDGGHGFPTPMIDWFYAGGRLRAGGTLVIDDVHLRAVDILTGFLDRDPRWSELRRTRKWVAYERLGKGLLGEDWWAQRGFFGPRRPRLSKVGDLVQRTRPALGALARRAGLRRGR